MNTCPLQNIINRVMWWLLFSFWEMWWNKSYSLGWSIWSTLSTFRTFVLPSCFFRLVASNELWFDLKMSCWKFDLGHGQGQGHGLIGKFMLHISRPVSSSGTYLRCFHCFSLSLSKVIAEKLPVTFYDLNWPCGHDQGSLVASFRFRVLPVTRCFMVLRMVFVPNQCFSIFSHWLIMERSQNWFDFRSPISKCWDKHFIDTCEVTWRDLVTWPCVTLVWNFHNICWQDVW